MAGSRSRTARALVVPTAARNTQGNFNNFSAGSRAKTRLVLVVDDATGQQDVHADVPNWLRIVLAYAGTNYGPQEELPAEIHIPVQIDGNGRIVAVDVDQAAAELEPYREAATRWWKRTDAPLADVRNAVALPGEAVRGARDLLGSWRGALSGLRDGAPRPVDPREAEQLHRTANTLKYVLQRDPKQYAKVRASALQAGPMMADSTKAGGHSTSDFESWLDFQLTSGAVTDGEVDEWRSRAGLT